MSAYHGMMFQMTLSEEMGLVFCFLHGTAHGCGVHGPIIAFVVSSWTFAGFDFLISFNFPMSFSPFSDLQLLFKVSLLPTFVAFGILG